MKNIDILNYVKEVIETEANAVMALIEQANPNYELSAKIILDCKGKVIVTGVGKSGHIGRKIAASLASTGTPSFFIHSTEGVHGDLGMIQENDVVILISNSGNTSEVINLLPTLNRIGCKLIAITSKEDSIVAKSSDVALTYFYNTEADHLGLAPTTSSTLTLVIGDVLAITTSYLKNFKKKDFHLYHPGGALGKQLSNISKER